MNFIIFIIFKNNGLNIIKVCWSLRKERVIINELF